MTHSTEAPNRTIKVAEIGRKKINELENVSFTGKLGEDIQYSVFWNE